MSEAIDFKSEFSKPSIGSKCKDMRFRLTKT